MKIPAVSSYFAPLRNVVADHVARWRAKLAPLYAEVRNRYRQLESREKFLLKVAAALITLIVLYDFVILPAEDFASGLDARIASQRHALAAAHRLARQYATLKRELAAARKRTLAAHTQSTLFSVLEPALSKSIAHEKITSITPSERKLPGNLVEHRLDLKLTNISLKQLVTTLYAIKTLPEPVAVPRLTMKKRFDDQSSFDVEMTCSTLSRSH